MANFTRTIAALEAYDITDAEYRVNLARISDAEEMTTWANLHELEADVCRAFFEDTRPTNSLETCMLLRVGPKIPNPGYTVSFVRRMARDFHHP